MNLSDAHGNQSQSSFRFSRQEWEMRLHCDWLLWATDCLLVSCLFWFTISCPWQPITAQLPFFKRRIRNEAALWLAAMGNIQLFFCWLHRFIYRPHVCSDPPVLVENRGQMEESKASFPLRFSPSLPVYVGIPWKMILVFQRILRPSHSTLYIWSVSRWYMLYVPETRCWNDCWIRPHRVCL